MWVNNLPKVAATQWNSGATRDSNPGHRARIPSALTTRPLSHTVYFLFFSSRQQPHGPVHKVKKRKSNVKSFPSHKAHRASLISVSLALSQTPVYTASPVPTYYAAVPLTLGLFELKIGTPVTPALGTFTSVSLHFFVFELGAGTWRTDGRTDEQAKPLMRPTRTNCVELPISLQATL